MIHPATDAEEADDFDEAIDELARTALRNLILAALGVYLLWYIVATASWPERFDWSITGLSVILVGGSVLALRLLDRHLRLAQLLWLAAIALTTTLAYWHFDRPEITFGFVLLPFLAVITMHGRAGLVAQGAVAAWIIVLSQVNSAHGVSAPEGTAIVLCGAGMTLVGWIISRTQRTTLAWYAYSYAKAETSLQAVRQHRGQLMRVQKSLDEAYYRLQRTNAALAAASRSASEAERFKAEFVTNVSHELRTPLNLIIGYSEVMMTSPESYGGCELPGPYRSDLNAIYHSAQHLLTLVDDVLDLARIEVGKIALARDEVDLADLIGEALDIVSDYIATKGLDLQVKVDSDLPRLWIDRLRIRQVLLNLLVNAARFTERGFIRVEARHCRPDGNEPESVIVRITDSGRGIPAQDLPIIFEEFRSTEQPISTWHSGTGLGLPISKRFVELNGGKMGVESTYLQGTSFWFTLPCRAHGATARSAEAQPPNAQDARSPNGAQDEVASGVARKETLNPLVRLTPSQRIVVAVHPDPRMSTLLQRYLDGYRVLAAPNLAEGAALAEAAKALAVISDAHDSQDDKAVALPEGVLHVRCAWPDARHAALELGADTLLVKPVVRAELEAAIDRLERPVCRILIADDDPEMVRLLRRMVTARGTIEECLEAYNGEEALTLVRLHRPDLVLLDLVMPGTDGQSVLQQMAADPELAMIATIVISAKGLDYANAPLRGAVHLERAEGFVVGELVRMLESVLSALAPGWHAADATPAAASKAPVG